MGILVDEMYVKEVLVFDKHSGLLTGFLDLWDITTHLIDYERQSETSSEAASKNYCCIGGQRTAC